MTLDSRAGALTPWLVGVRKKTVHVLESGRRRLPEHWRLRLPQFMQSRRRPLLIALFLLAVVVLMWLAAAVATTLHIFGGSTISGLDVGGLSPAQARTRVAAELRPTLSQPVTLQAGQASIDILPTDVDARLDPAASVAELTRFTLNPLTLWSRLHGQTVSASVPFDAQALTQALTDNDDTLTTAAQDATVTLDGTTPVLTPAVTGTRVDVAASVARWKGHWPVGHAPLTLVTTDVPPTISDEDAHALVDNVLTPLLASDLTVTAAGTDVQADATADLHLTPAQIAALTTIAAQDGSIQATLNPQGLRDVVVAAMGTGIERSVKDATATIDASPDATPVFVPAQSGRVIDADTLAAALMTAGMTGTDATSRTVALSLKAQEPTYAQDEAHLGVKEIVGEYATPYYVDPVRTQNLIAGTAAINGTLVRAGETFSLENALGTIDAEHGFVDSGVVINGVHSNAMGGGLSQVATTTFNAAFEAGMDDVEHHPHSVWFTRYPAGREATLWTGHLDVKWTNSTPYAVLVQAWAGDGYVHVRLWSTHYYQVSISDSGRTNYRPVTTEHSKTPGCEPYSGGEPGFDITVTRTRRAPDGQSPAPDTLTTSYAPDNALECQAP